VSGAAPGRGAAATTDGDVKADPWDQLRLLDLQALDSSLDRLEHRRRSLPELARIEELQGVIEALDDRIVLLQTDDSDLGREQAKLETDIEVVRGRMTRDQQRLDAGTVGSARELENLQSEITSLHRRQNDLEDSELELMQQREDLAGQITALTAERDEAVAELTAAEQRRDTAYAEIEAQGGTDRAARVELVGSLPAELVALYERIRASSAGIGAAALHRGRCEGCHLALNTTDLNAIRAASSDEVIRCEECRRIQVRTAESGL
jgi:hypothetical protein